MLFPTDLLMIDWSVKRLINDRIKTRCDYPFAQFRITSIGNFFEINADEDEKYIVQKATRISLNKFVVIN